MVVRIKTCKRCGWEWASKVETPVQCPACRSKYWDKDRVNDIPPEKMAKKRGDGN